MSPVVWQHVTEPARSHFLNVTQEEIGLLLVARFN
jgi:hypothetical protein